MILSRFVDVFSMAAAASSILCAAIALQQLRRVNRIAADLAETARRIKAAEVEL